MKKILLSTSVLLAMSVNAQIPDCNDLFFSEYVEGSSQNKAIEIYNPTTTSIDLSDYSVERFSAEPETFLIRVWPFDLDNYNKEFF